MNRSVKKRTGDRKLPLHKGLRNQVGKRRILDRLIGCNALQGRRIRLHVFLLYVQSRGLITPRLHGHFAAGAQRVASTSGCGQIE